MPRRGENIYKRKDGRWEGRYIADRKPDGKAVYRSIYGTSYAQVRERLVAKRQETHKRQIGSCKLTVNELLALWQAENSQIKATSRERYRALIELHIQPELGARKVREDDCYGFESNWAADQSSSRGEGVDAGGIGRAGEL